MPEIRGRALSRSTLLLLGLVVLGGGLLLGLRARADTHADAGPAPAAVDEALDEGEVAAVVRMTDRMTFAPAAVTIKAGQAIRWTNPSKVVHTATARSVPEGAASFDSGDVAPGGSFSHTFKTAGRYRYVCVPHAGAGMVGTIIVEG